MDRKIACVVLVALLLALSSFAEEQRAKKILRLGCLSNNSLSAVRENAEGFQQGLHELDYVEGKHIIIEYKWAEGINARLPDLARGAGAAQRGCNYVRRKYSGDSSC